MREQSFADFMRAVNAEINKLCGMSASDIDDWTYADDFDRNVKPACCARRAVRNARKNSGL